MSAYFCNDIIFQQIASKIKHELEQSEHWSYHIPSIISQVEKGMLTEALQKLNNESLLARYGEKAVEKVRNISTTINTHGLTKILNYLSEYLYQCSEGDIDESKLFKEIQYFHYCLLQRYFRECQGER